MGVTNHGSTADIQDVTIFFPVTGLNGTTIPGLGSGFNGIVTGNASSNSRRGELLPWDGAVNSSRARGGLSGSRPFDFVSRFARHCEPRPSVP
jgi:hypothetical protein